MLGKKFEITLGETYLTKLQNKKKRQGLEESGFKGQILKIHNSKNQAELSKTDWILSKQPTEAGFSECTPAYTTKPSFYPSVQIKHQLNSLLCTNA